ncbi:MAG: DUF4080 domain-containing protein [Clostridiales bacterium]|nr:DUF4080 domain-containing protein [Candidatus Crickella equi]
MKILLSTIKSDKPATELALKYMYSIVADAPVESQIHTFDTIELDNDIYEYILRGQYTLVYLHCDEMNEYRISRISEMVKKAMPTTIIVVGGIQVSFDTKQFMQDNPCVDFVIRGEGETVFFNFIKTILTYEYEFDQIAGLAYRENDEIHVNPYDAIISIDELPFPYDKVELKDSDTVYYETIRGTSDRTIYRQYLPDARVRSLPLGRVCTELRYFFVKGVEKVVFLDRWFNYNTERAYRILEYIINNDNGKTSFELDIDGDSLDEETVRLLGEARPGLFEFNVDVASTNPETLAAIGRGENIYQLMYNVTKLMQLGNVKTRLRITAGLPMETEELFARSFNKVYGLGEGSSLIIDTARVPRGCLLREDAGKFGYLYTSHAPYDVLANAFISATDLIKIKTLAKVAGTFINDNFKLSLARILNDTGMKPYNLFIKLTDYIYDNGLNVKMNKQENLYRIMYSFAITLYDDLNDTLKLQILAEVLHEDLENNLSEEAVKKFERKGWEIEA